MNFSFGDPHEEAEGLDRPDFLISSWYHRKISESLIAKARFAAVNLHPSLLPAYRGATPIEWAIMRGESETGLSLHHLAPKIDAGNLLWQRKVKIESTDSAGDLGLKLASHAGEAWDVLLRMHRAGDLTGRPQEVSGAFWLRKRTEEDGLITSGQSARAIFDRVRAYLPWPKATIEIGGRLLKVGGAEWAGRRVGESASCGETCEWVDPAGEAVLLTDLRPKS